MGFNWSRFANELGGAVERGGQIIGGALMEEYRRQKDEQQRLREMKQGHEYRMVEQQAADAASLAKEKEMLGLRLEKQQEYERANYEWQRKVDNFFGSTAFLAHVENGLKGGDMFTKAAVMAQVQALNKLKANMALTDEDEKVLAAIQDQNVAAGIAGLRMEHQKFNTQIQQTEALTRYYDSMSKYQNWLRTQGGKDGISYSNILSTDKEITDLNNEVAKLMGNDTFRMIAAQVDKKKAKGMSEEEALAALAQEGHQSDVMFYQNQVMTMQGIQQHIQSLTAYRKALEDTFFTKRGMDIPGRPKPFVGPPEGRERPTEEEVPEQEKGAGGIWSDLKWVLGKGGKAVQKGFAGKPFERRLRRDYAIPENGELIVFEDADELEEFRRDPASLGKYVWDPETQAVFRFIQKKEGGVIGFQRVPKR